MVPPAVRELVERFEANRETYRAAAYNEAQLREEFLNPLFKALGWDVYNEKGYADAYKEVIHEDALKIGGRTKAPDYCFRAGGGVRSFFVEAKKPAVDIGEAVSPAYQLRRYAWSAKLAVSILTDFEELAVYDCRIRPQPTDKAAVGRVLLLRYPDYLERWDELAGLFSPEAIRRGALDRFVASKKVKKGTAEVDAAFLDEIESWRDVLARNLALRNPDLSERDLNYAVQATIDRLVFLRICEDRGVELYGTLQAAANGQGVYARLAELFQRADERYNSGLFHFDDEKGRPEEPDRLTLGLAVDDKPLRAIIGNLYYPESPYEFSVFPAEILGQVYEQFLGKVIRLTKGHQARVEEKPEVRKAGGVYYTPAYIVDYIVRHTVGALLEGGGEKAEGGGETAEGGGVRAGRKMSPLPPGEGRGEGRMTPQQAMKLKVLDPACGSGSFLIGAYQYLLDWFRDRYVEEGAEKHAKGRKPHLCRGPSGDWRLTTAHRKEILLNCVYGVDIDPQAVEVTKLSLLLKVLEGESQESLANQLRLFHERALPDLAANIRCGNSLIGPDFYEGRQMGLLDEEEVYRVNAFDWQDRKHGFGQIMAQGGFDAVIGNPPYVRQEGVSANKAYFSKHYQVFHGLADLYVYFYERSSSLLASEGLLGFITSSKFIHSSYGMNLRRFLGSSLSLRELIDYGDRQLFHGAVTYLAVVIALNQPRPDATLRYARATAETSLDPEDIITGAVDIPLSYLCGPTWVLASDKAQKTLAALESDATPLAEIAGAAQLGIKTSLNEVFVIDGESAAQMLSQDPHSIDVIRPYGRGRDLHKWYSQNNGMSMVCSRISLDIDDYPAVKSYLLKHEKRLKSRYEVRRGDYDWWVVRQVADTTIFENEKIVYPDLCSRSAFALNDDGMFPNNTVFCLRSANPALLGFLNSRLAWFWVTHNCPANRGGAYRLFNQYMDRMPVRASVLDSEELRQLAMRAVALQRRALTKPGGMHERTTIDRQIAATDRRIDRLVYELYGLTDEEIAVVEGDTL